MATASQSGDKAVDGKDLYNGRNSPCARTQVGYKNWLYVDLGDWYYISSLIVYGSKDYSSGKKHAFNFYFLQKEKVNTRNNTHVSMYKCS
jgi:hypothetical protein